MTHSTQRWRILLIAVAVVFLGCSGIVYFGHEPQRLFMKLVGGDESVRVTGLSGPQVPYPHVLEDPESMAYLTRALRSAQPMNAWPDSDQTGPSIQLDITLNGFWAYGVDITLSNPKHTVGLFLSIYSELDNYLYFWVPLPEPMPLRLAELFSRVRKEDEERRSNK